MRRWTGTLPRLVSVGLIPVLSVGTAVLLRSLLENHLNGQGPLLFFPPAVMVAAWFGGLAGGLVATVLSVPAAVALLTSFQAFYLESPADRWALFLLVCISVAISIAGQWLRQAQRNLARSEDHLRRVLDSIYAFVGVLTPDGALILANRSPLEMAGLKESEVLGRLFWDAPWWNYSNEVQQRLQDAIARARGGEASRYDVDVRGKDGALIPLDFMITPMRDERGQITHLIPSAVPIAERKRAELALRESEERLRQSQKAAQACSWSFDIDGSRLTWDDNAPEVFGFAPDAAARIETWRAAVYPADLPAAEAAIRKSLQEGAPLDSEYRIVRNGEIRWIANKGQMRPGGHLLTGISLDITARKRAEESSRRNEVRFRSVFENAAVGMAVVDLNGRWLDVNQRLCDIVGYTREEMLSRTFHEITHPEDVAEAVRHARELQEGAIGSYLLEKRYLRKDGSVVWVQLTRSLLRNDDGTPESFISIIEDIGGRKEAEERLRRSEAHLRQAADTMPQLVWVTAADGRTEWYNRRWFDYTGLSLEQSTGEKWAEAFHADDVAVMRERWGHSVATGDAYEVEARCRRSDGEYRWFLVRGLPIRSENGEILQWFGTCTDIHDHKLVLSRLEQANEDLKEYGFAASHDLQEPLRMVVSFTQLLERGYRERLDERGLTFIQNAVEGAKRMEVLLSDLRDFWQASEESDVPSAIVDTETALADALAQLSVSIQEAGAVVTHDPLPAVRGQEAAMKRLFQNLVGNAVKYRDPARPARIHVSAARQHDQWIFTIADNGIGVPREYTARVFGLFKRLHRKEEYPGTGIGLALCEKIVQRMGGRIWMESEVGVGSKLRFTLPVVTG